MSRSLIFRSFSLLGIVLLIGQLSAQTPVPAEDIRGPKALIEIPVPEKSSMSFWLEVLLVALVIAFAVFAWQKWLKRKFIKSPPEIAFAALNELERSGDSVAAEAFANRAAQTLRIYIADRFGIEAPRRTTEEFLRDLAKQDNTSLTGESDVLKGFLKSCDLAKFAGSNLDSIQRVELIQSARRFIQSTSKIVTP